MTDKNLAPSEYASSITPRPIPVTTLFPGAQTPRDSAFLSQKSLDIKQTELANIAKGGRGRGRRSRYRRKWNGGQSTPTPTVVVPSLTVDYPNAGDIHNTNIKVTQSLMQNQANAQFDSNVVKKGGGINWGCYSGGRRALRKTNRKSKKSSRRHRKSRKTRKTRK